MTSIFRQYGAALPDARYKKFVLASAFFLFCSFALPVVAQVSTGSITGIISDPSQAVISQATVRIVNVDTSVSRVLTTDSAGLYRAPDIEPGNYFVEVSAPGFQLERRTGLTLSIGQTLTLNFTLQPGSVKQTVTVAAASTGTVDSSTSTVSDTVSQRAVQDLPLNGRNFINLVGLVAGAEPASLISTFNGGEFDINGGRPEGNLLLIDGMDVVPESLDQISLEPNLEALSEFQVQTSNFSAEYGRSLGGVVNAHIKSGTNQFHGSLFEYFRNNDLDAVTLYQVANPPLHFNQFGGSLGGPILKNKLFFFGDYQGTRDLTSSTGRATIPTPAMTTPNADGNYDFSSVCTAGFTGGICNNPAQQIYNPFNFPRTPFPNNQIPMGLADPTVALMFTYFPAPNCIGNPALCGSANFIKTQPSSNPQNSGDVRIDYHPTDRDQLGLSMIFISAGVDQPSIYGPYLNNYILTDVTADFYKMAALTYTHIFSPALANQFAFGIPTQHAGGPPTEGMQYQPSIAGLGGLNTSSTDIYTTGFPLIEDASTGTLFGSGAGGPFLQHANTPQLADNLTWIKGRHAFKTGLTVRWREYNINQSSWARGLYVTDALETSNSSLVGGYGFASDLLGDPLEAIKEINLQEAGERIKEVGAYFQDDFKATPRLTLNLGLRWDLYGPATDVHNRLANFDPTTVSMIFPGNGNSPSTLDTNYLNFQPRIGFAYALTADGKTVVRGGYGIAYLPLQYQAAGTTTDRLLYNTPFSYNNTSVYSDNLFLPPGNTLVSDGLPIQIPANPADIPLGALVVYIPKSQPTPRVEQWSLGIQRMLPHNIAVLDVGYIGTTGIHLTGYQNLNQWPAGTSSAASPISPNVGVVEGLLNDNRSIYHSLQVKVNRNFSSGFGVWASYVYSRSIDDDSDTTQEQPQNAFDLAAERAPSDFNVTHRAVISFLYELPFGNGKRYLSGNRIVNAVAGGWQVNSIISAQTGNPFSVIYSVGDAGINAGPGGNVRPNIVGDPNRSGMVEANPTCSAPAEVHIAAAWYNPCAFVAPVNSFGDAGRNIIVGPGLFNIDASLFKTFPLVKRSRLEFRSEFFNVLNHPNLGQPNPTFDAPAGSQQPGQILSASPGRIVQLALKVLF